MVVQHNLTAMNANRMLGLTMKTLSKSTEKLSSGYKINRAADDAAGLSISEKMRKQIRGLTQASDNAEDGISAVQTAEGALTEVHDMLQRMNELAVKAANGTMSEDDRQTVQDEVDQLLTEIDRVAETTKFNEIYLLKGDPDEVNVNVTLNAHDAGIAGFWLPDANEVSHQNDTDVATTTFCMYTPKIGEIITIGGVDYTVVTSASFNAIGEAAALSEYKISIKKAAEMACEEIYKANQIGDIKNAATVSVGWNITGTDEDTITDITFEITKGVAEASKALFFSLHVGADADMNNKIGVTIEAMDTAGLGINKLRVKDDSGVNATYAIDAIADAVAKVSKQRSALGAVQNRLEHTINNLDNIVENTTAAESQIRDTDMATEMVKYSNSNILAQAGQSMLAQANQANQGILSLLG